MIDDEAMIPSRLAQDPPPRSPSELVVDAVRQNRRLDSLLDRIRLLTEIRDGAEYCVERMIGPEQDRAKITLALLRVGALGGPPSQAVSLTQAAHASGWGKVVQASLAVYLLASCQEAAKGCGCDGVPLFRRSLVTGVAAGRMGLALGFSEGDSFALGLLHDLGVLGMAAWQQQEYLPYISGAVSPEPDEERSAFDLDHPQAGLALLIYRGFNSRVCEAAAFHHGSLERISLYARLAACASAMAAQGCDSDHSAMISVLGISASDSQSICSEVRSASLGISSLFG